MLVTSVFLCYTNLFTEDLPHAGVGNKCSQQGDAMLNRGTGAAKTVAGLRATTDSKLLH